MTDAKNLSKLQDAEAFPLELLGMDLDPTSMRADAGKNKWFNGTYYIETYGAPAEGDLFVHFCRIGVFFGACPNPQAHEIIKERVSTLKAKLDGDEDDAFDPEWYARTYLSISALTLDPWEHFVSIGRQRGYAMCRPTPEPDNTANKAANEAIAPLRTLDPDGLGDLIDTLKVAIGTLIERDGGPGWDVPHDVHRLYFNARLADAAYASVLGHEPDFKTYLVRGYLDGIYPNLATAHFDECILKRARDKVGPTQFRAIPRLSGSASPHDVFVKRLLKGPAKRTNKETGAFASLRRHLVNDLFDPNAYYASTRSEARHVSSVQQLLYLQTALSGGGLFDPNTYLSGLDISLTDQDAAVLYILAGQTLGHEGSPGFDRLFYTETYPDIIRSGSIPDVHYQIHGRDENRLSVGDAPIGRIEGAKRFRKSKPSVLVFSHEASLSGAPIVALNIARALAKDHDVVAWVGEPGPLDNEFVKTCTEVCVGWGSRRDFAEVINTLRERHAFKGAIVNSIVSNPVMPRLKAAGLPVMGTIHEFANYVYPSGTTSRGAVLADASVYPARIVADAMRQEFDRHGVPVPEETIHVRHQGYNSTGGDNADQAADDIRVRLGAGADSVVIMGAGNVEPRKGVDLFLQAAQRCRALAPETDWKFIWVGGGYDPVKDLNFSLYLDMQIRLNGLEDVVTLFGHQPTLAPFWEVADIFFLSSRLDPFPNVVLDALTAKVPVVCFERAMGFEDIIKHHPYAMRAAPFLDVQKASEAIINTVDSREDIANDFADASLSEDLAARLSFDSYVDDLKTFLKDAKTAHARFEKLRKVLAKTGLRRLRSLSRRLPGFVFPAGDGYDREQLETRIAAFLSSYPTIPYALKPGLPDVFGPSRLIGASDEFADPAKRADAASIVLHAKTAEHIDRVVSFFDVSRHRIQASVRTAGTSATLGELPVQADMVEALSSQLKTVEDDTVIVADITGIEGDPALTDPLSTLFLGLKSGRFSAWMSERDHPAIVPIDFATYDRDALPVVTDRIVGCFDSRALKAALDANTGETPDAGDPHRIARLYKRLADKSSTDIAGAVPAWFQ